MNDIQSREDEIYEVMRPISTGLAATVKNFFNGPSSMEVYLQLKREILHLRYDMRIQLLQCVIELAKLNQLSDEKFRLLMIAFSLQ